MRIQTTHHFARRSGWRRQVAFTLLEMLVVLIIIAMLAALALPAIRGSLESRAIDGASRQLLEDLSLARQKAISQRTVVAVVFLTDQVFDSNEVPLGNADPEEQKEISRLQAGAFTHYAFYQFRRVGEQPGRGTKGYITEWKSLPEKTFLATNNNFSVMQLWKNVRWPFPFSRSGDDEGDPTPIQPSFPYIAFDAQGRSVKIPDTESMFDLQPTADVDISIARGAVFYARDNAGALLNFELQEIPPLNATQNVIHVDALTGRGRWIKAELQ